MKNFAGEGLKGALQFIFIMITILATLVMCSYNAHADYQEMVTLMDKDFVVDGKLDELGLNLALEEFAFKFINSHYHSGQIYLKFIQIPGGTLAILECKCKSQEAHNESNTLQKMLPKSGMPTDNSG